jgi:hypothetical protein
VFLLSIRGCLNSKPTTNLHQRNYVLLAITAGFFAVLLIHLLFLGDASFLNKGVIGIDDNLTLLKTTYGILYKRATTAQDTALSIKSILEVTNGVGSDCINAAARMKSINERLLTSLVTFTAATGSLTDRVGNLIDATSVVASYRSVFLYIVYSVGMVLILTGIIGYCYRFKPLIRVTVASMLIYVLGCISVCTIIMAVAVGIIS